MKKFRMLAVLAALGTVPFTVSAAEAIPEVLRDAARKSVVNNPEVQARWHAFRAADSEQDVARGGYFPQVDLTAGSERERLKEPGRSTDTYTHSYAALSLNQMVFDGFFTRNEVARLGNEKLARYYDLVDASESIVLEAVRAYADVLRYRELVGFAKANYVEHRQIYDHIQERAQSGMGRRADLEQAAGRLALSESNLLVEVTNLHDVSARYQRIVGEVPGEGLPVLGDHFQFDGIPSSSVDVLQEAFSTNPALNASLASVRANQFAVEAQRAANLPRVDLRASQAVDRNLSGVDGTQRETSVGVVLSYNLFRGGSDQARIQRSAELLNYAKDVREKTCRDLRQTVSIAYNDALRLEEQRRYLKQHEVSTEKTREAYRKQFDIGQRQLLDLLDTENEYFQARRAYVNANYDRIVAQARTLAGIGRLMPAMQVARENMPTVSELGVERSAEDVSMVCPPESPDPLVIDKKALLEETLRAAGVAPK